MGYMHIDNLYKIQDILLFKECYALEKIHGTSAHLSWKGPCADMTSEGLRFFAGGESHTNFVKLFDEEALKAKFTEAGTPEITIYGEAYGGKQQGMSATYGKELKFVAFDVKIGDNWLSVPQADAFVQSMGLEFVYYTKISTDMASIDAARDADSQQAIRNGVGPGKKMEGVVLRPLIELTKNNGSRIIAKHKRDEFKETATPREVTPDRLKVLSDAQAVADEWVTPMRLTHVLDKVQPAGIEDTPKVIAAMIEDVQREGAGEIEWSKDVAKAVGSKAAKDFKDRLKAALHA